MPITFPRPQRPSIKPIQGRFSTGSIALGLAILLLPPPTEALAADVLDEVTGVRLVCTASADQAIARAQRGSGNAAVAAAETLPNPALVVEHQRTLTGAAEHETVLGLSFPLQLNGRRALLRDAARARREQAFATARATLFDAALDFREAYAVAVTDRARVQVLAEQQVALEALSQLVAGLAKRGEAAGYDLLRQQTQARLHRQQLERATAEASGSVASLRAWTNKAVTLPEIDLATFAKDAPIPATTATPLNAPRVQSLQAEVRASGFEARAARRRWLPDLDVFAGYRAVNVGPDVGHGVAVGLTIPLTFFDHGQGEAVQAEAEQQLALTQADRLRQLYNARGNAARLRLKALLAALAATEATVVDALTLQAQATQLYALGEATITELLEAYRSTEEARLAQLELLEGIAFARLSLMRATGTMFDSSLDRECNAGGGVAP